MRANEFFNQQIACSMSYSIKVTSNFAKEAKRLAKKYPSFKKDYEELKNSLQENPLQGDELTPGIRKIRLAIRSKGKGKSGGARVITFNVLAEQQNGMVVLVLIYDKSDFSTVDVNTVKELIRDEGYKTESAN